MLIVYFQNHQAKPLTGKVAHSRHAARSSVFLAVANRLHGTIRRVSHQSPGRMLLHHRGWGSRKARGDAESVPRAPPETPRYGP